MTTQGKQKCWGRKPPPTLTTRKTTSEIEKQPSLSDCALDLTGLQARGANIHSLGRTLHKSANTLNVWVPTAAGTHVGVRDALAERGLLAADVTYRSHGFLLISLTGRQRRLLHAKDGNPEIIAILVISVQVKVWWHAALSSVYAESSPLRASGEWLKLEKTKGVRTMVDNPTKAPHDKNRQEELAQEQRSSRDKDAAVHSSASDKTKDAANETAAARKTRGIRPLPASNAVISDNILERPLERVLGKQTANALAKLELTTVNDLLYHVPFRLAHRGELMPIENVTEGESVTVVAEVLDTNLRPMNARRGFILTVKIAEGMHELSVTFFAKSRRPLDYHEQRLTPGTIASFSGTVSSYRGTLQLSHPEYAIVEDEVDPARLERPIPIYRASEKLPTWRIQKAVETILPLLDEIPDPLPDFYRQANKLPNKREALRSLHSPRNDYEWHKARLRMRHEEAFILQTIVAQRAQLARSRTVTAYPRVHGGLLDSFDSALPYTLTQGQKKVGEEISADLSSVEPMQRLLQGDVGSGKTVVALRAMLQVLDAGGQAALLAPTEVLAYQHVRTIENLLGPLTPIELLTGSLTSSARRGALARIASGQAGLIVGTHALLSDDVQIPFLGLAVIDEQHRFGVDQRDALASGIHTLVMTATPIPRTLAMSVFGDLDVSLLDELPAGRASVNTTVVPHEKTAWIARVWERVAEEIKTGGRAYVVCPRIDEVDSGPIKLTSAVEMAQYLRKHPALANVGIGLMHGKLSAEEKAQAMDDFSSGQTPILVSTTVIEVGVDVPEATVMVIMDAERFGLSQLHQLRGRIGRGNKPGVCLALTRAGDDSLSMARLNAFASTTNGFDLAEKDVELRSEGDVLGASQAGRGSHLRFLSVTKDREIIERARASARQLVEDNPTLAGAPALAAAVQELDSSRADYLEKG